MIQGSYYNGFAPRDGMPLYPSLWRGCVGAWAPCLGPTGLTLRDWSGYGQNAAITNATLATAWAVLAGRYALTLDGTDDYAAVSEVSWPTNATTVSLWVNPSSFTGTPFVFAARNVSAFSAIGIALGSTSTIFECRTTSSQDLASTLTVLTANVWQHVTVTFLNGTVTFFLNGRQTDTKTSSGSTFASTGSGTTLGAFSASQQRLNGSLDDIRWYNRALAAGEIAILASRRGIAYDLAPFAMPYSEQAGFQAAWALRQRLILGGGGGLG